MAYFIYLIYSAPQYHHYYRN